MHVLQLGPYPPPEGGVTRNLLAIRDELIGRGHRCSVIATSRSSHIVPETDVYHPGTVFDLIGVLTKLKFDVLHVHVGGDVSPRIMGLLTFCALAARGKSVLTFHSGGYASENVATAKPTSLRGGIFRLFRRVICVNPVMKHMFENYGVPEDRLRVIQPFSLSLPDTSVSIPDQLSQFISAHSPCLLTVGALEEEYEMFALVDALGEVLQTFPKAGLMIVGGGSLRNELESKIDSKPYANNVLLAGNVPHKVTLHLINDCDILLRTTRFDGDAISVREALHLGTPVIATDNGMRPAGVYLIPTGFRRDALAEKIVEVNNNGVGTPQTDSAPCDQNIAEVLAVYQELLRA
jgi:glycosyltransferase involved in cell wall biosynthesis